MKKQALQNCGIFMNNINVNSANSLTNKMIRLRASLFSDDDVEVWLYGSRARGDNREDSDWDLLVIVNKQISFREAYDQFAYPFVELGWDYDQAIVPVVYTRPEWENEKNSMFYHNVMKDRIRI